MERQACVITKPGVMLGKTSERLAVKEKGTVVDEIPFIHLDAVSIESRGVSLSSDLVGELAERGIPVYFSDFKGPYAMLYSPLLTGTIITRRSQLDAYRNQRGVDFVKLLISAKIQNQSNLLRNFGKYRRKHDDDLYEAICATVSAMDEIRSQIESMQAACIDDLRGTLLSAEGRAADRYWQMVARILTPRYDFPGRTHQDSTDPMNSFLNYGYAILYREVTSALLLAGLDPYAGFMHADRSGKLSLVFDMVEPFRPCVVDHALLAFVGKGGQIEMDDENRLSDASRKTIAAKVNERLDSTERYDGKRHQLRNLIHMQARQLATYLRGEGLYKPLIAGW